MTEPSPDFRYEITGDPPVLRAFGDIDLESSSDFGAALAAMAEGRGDQVTVVDLAGVTFLDSSGLNVLAAFVAGGGSLAVRNPSSVARRVIEATGLDAILGVEP